MTGTPEAIAVLKARPVNDSVNPALENIYARRSVRSFKDDAVADGAIGEILRAGIYAPTAMNQQPCRFVVIRNAEKIRQFGQRARKLWVELYKDSTDPGITSLVRVMSRPGMDIFYGAPVLVLVLSAPEAFRGEIDCTLAAENMMLAARSLGLGSCWIGLAMPLGQDAEFRKETGMPAGYTLVAPLIFGYPAKDGQKAPARNADVIVNWID